jgi:hypothetical protein
VREGKRGKKESNQKMQAREQTARASERVGSEGQKASRRGKQGGASRERCKQLRYKQKEVQAAEVQAERCKQQRCKQQRCKQQKCKQ